MRSNPNFFYGRVPHALHLHSRILIQLFIPLQIRLFNQFADEVHYLIDFQSSWFSKFVAPECILQQELDILQIRCNRDIFLQSFNLIDDFELEFILQFESIDTGSIKVIKTRESYVIEANVPFEIEKNITNEENYEFPENQLLLNAENKHIKNLKGVFKSNAKTEILQMTFLKDRLSFKGEQGVNRFGYTVKGDQLNSYGRYLTTCGDKGNEFMIAVALKHILALIKICELVEGKFMSAMELVEESTCVCFLFSHSERRDFKFTIGMANVRFQTNQQAMQMEEEKMQQVRLKKTKPSVNKQQNGEDHEMNDDQVDLNLKKEEHYFEEQEEDQLKIEDIKKEKKKKKTQKKKQVDDQDMENEQVQICMEDLLKVEKQDDEEETNILDIKEEVNDVVKKENKKNGKRNHKNSEEENDEGDMKLESDSDQDDKMRFEERKKAFYKGIDEEDFF